MRASLIVNGKELGDYIGRGGIKVSPVYRNQKSITTLDGTMFLYEQEKKKISVTFLDKIYDEHFADIMSYVKQTNPAEVEYTDFENEETITGLFYIRDTVDTAVSDLSVITEATLSLEQQ